MKPIMLTNPQEVEFNEKVDESIGLMKRQAFNARMEVIEARLKELKLLHLLKDIKKRRFKPIQIVESEKEITVWVDNKTLKGLRLVTFLKDTESEIKDGKFSGKLRYY